jgi:hypothetical protein
MDRRLNDNIWDVHGSLDVYYIMSLLNGVKFAYHEHISWHICHLLVYQPLDKYW